MTTSRNCKTINSTIQSAASASKTRSKISRTITHTSQHDADPEEKFLQDQQWFLETIIRPMVRAPDQQQTFVLPHVHMDQTSVYLSMEAPYTLRYSELHGEESTVNGRRTSESGTRFTVPLTISFANGDKLKPYLIFKGEPTGIPTRELCFQEPKQR